MRRRALRLLVGCSPAQGMRMCILRHIGTRPKDTAQRSGWEKIGAVFAWTKGSMHLGENLRSVVSACIDPFKRTPAARQKFLPCKGGNYAEIFTVWLKQGDVVDFALVPGGGARLAPSGGVPSVASAPPLPPPRPSPFPSPSPLSQGVGGRQSCGRASRLTAPP